MKPAKQATAIFRESETVELKLDYTESIRKDILFGCWSIGEASHDLSRVRLHKLRFSRRKKIVYGKSRIGSQIYRKPD